MSLDDKLREFAANNQEDMRKSFQLYKALMTTLREGVDKYELTNAQSIQAATGFCLSLFKGIEHTEDGEADSETRKLATKVLVQSFVGSIVFGLDLDIMQIAIDLSNISGKLDRELLGRIQQHIRSK